MAGNDRPSHVTSPWFPMVVVLAAVSSSIGGSIVTHHQSQADQLFQQLRSAPQTFFSEPLGLSWWVRGGEPGSPSDKLSVEWTRDAGKATYIRARIDHGRKPPAYSETFTAPLDQNQFSRLLRLAFESPLFRMDFSEEADRGMRDVKKETWRFQRGREDALIN